MRGDSHLIFGMAFLAAANLTPVVDLDAVTLAAAAAGSLLPDIDHPGSALGRRVRPLSDVVGLVLGHRGLTHSLLAALACVVAAVWFGLRDADLAVALALGYLSHLFGDWLTPSGVPLQWPNRRPFRAPHRWQIRTGGLRELLLVTTVGLASLALAVLLN